MSNKPASLGWVASSPSSRRSAYVGNDQYAAGSVAAQLIGQALTRTGQNILVDGGWTAW